MLKSRPKFKLGQKAYYFKSSSIGIIEVTVVDYSLSYTTRFLLIEFVNKRGKKIRSGMMPEQYLFTTKRSALKAQYRVLNEHYQAYYLKRLNEAHNQYKSLQKLTREKLRELKNIKKAMSMSK